MTAWLHIVGIGEEGIEGLTPVTRAVVEAAEIIVGGSRHQSLINVNAERISWPSPFDALIEILKSKSGFSNTAKLQMANGFSAAMVKSVNSAATVPVVYV